jgi:N-acetylglutamate synthase-like GNAT family acetyltransferase
LTRQSSATRIGSVPTSIAELDDIESYYDTVPRANATVEDFGPFTLFVSTAGFPYYARPKVSFTHAVTAADVTAVRARQRQLGVPEAFEWVGELQPNLAEAVRAAGLVVFQLPLMIYRGGGEVGAPDAVTVRLIPADDPALPQVQAAIGVGFAAPGTEVGSAGDAERTAAEKDLETLHQGIRDRIGNGLHVLAGAFAASGAVGGGSHSPRGAVTEITGIATLPAYRRRGIGAAVTAKLVADARQHGARTCFLSAGSDEIARVYRRAGFERIATACIAGAPG